MSEVAILLLASLVLAQKGVKSDYAIQVPSDATPCIRHSAEEFSHTFRR